MKIKTKLISLLLSIFSLTLLLPVFAPIAIAQDGNPFQVEYYNNLAFEGDPAITKEVESITFNWGYDQPEPEVQNDYYTVKANSTQTFEDSEYTFEVTADDGVRVFVDEELVIDEWRHQAPTTYTANRHMSAGDHTIRIEYYEFNVGAFLIFDWYKTDENNNGEDGEDQNEEDPTPTPEPSGDSSIQAQYYNNLDLSGDPAHQTSVDAIDFNWGQDSPHPAIQTDNFSARWTTTQHFTEGFQKFVATSDDGVRVFVDGNKVIDGWRDQGYIEHTNFVYLSEGDHAVEVTYYERSFGAAVNVHWEHTSQPTYDANTLVTMPLGDSITHGHNVPGSYRTELLATVPYLELVGSEHDGPIQLSDKDHEGHPGWRIDEIHSNTSGWISFYNPNVVLLMLGTNDIVYNYDVNNAPSRLSSLIDYISAQSPSTTILVASIPPLTDYRNDMVNAFNAQLPGIVSEKQSQGKLVRFVDINAEMNAGDISQDGIHPNEAGHSKMAQAWATAIENLGEEPEEPINTPTPTPTPTGETEPTPTPIDDVPSTAYRAEYFNNISLEGEPALIREEQSIENEWGYGSPGNSIQSDFFSARWTKVITTEEDNYTFTATADDGVRVILDGVTIIDEWKDQGATTYTATVNMSAGEHTVVIEYYERWVGATAHFEWKRTSGNPEDEEEEEETEETGDPQNTTFVAEYFNNIELAGEPVVTQFEDEINFDLGYGSPHPAVQSDFFSTRWTGYPVLDAGTYRFTTTTDDGVRLRINGTTVINEWVDQGPTSYTAEVALPEGTHTIEMEYYEKWVGSYAHMKWSKL